MKPMAATLRWTALVTTVIAAACSGEVSSSSSSTDGRHDSCSACLLQALNASCAQQIECQCAILDCAMVFQCMRGCP